MMSPPVVESAPLWSALVAPVVLVALTYLAVAGDAVLAARAAGCPGTLAALVAPGRELARLGIAGRRRTVAPDALLWRLGLLTVPLAAVLAVLVVPLGAWTVADLDVGVVWFNAMEVLLWAALWMAGWGPNSAFGLVGGYRFVAQGLAYELPHMFALITAGLGAQSLRVGGIVAGQAHLWYVVWMPVAFAVYLLSAAAMAFWAPFDAPTGTDIGGGVGNEVSGVDRLALVGGRWLMLVAAAAFAVPLFLGGGNGPVLPAAVWTLVKTAAVLAALLWLRRRLPTVRMDRFVELAWVVLIPASILQALVVAVVVLNR